MPYSPRLYESEEDLIRMQEMLISARTGTDDWHYAHVGELTWNFFMVDCHLDPRGHILLWRADGRLIGYAVLGEDPSIDFQILPEHEWRGMEAEAVDWAERRLAELRRRDPQRWSGSLVSGSRKDNLQRREFLERRGFLPGGRFSEVNMIRPLAGDIPEAGIPPGYRIRAFQDSDGVSNRASVQREVWRPWTVGDVRDEDYERFMRLPAYHPDLDLVAVAPDGTIAAYANGWIDPVNAVGDIGPVGALPAHRRKGLTRGVLLECLRRMRARGMDRVCVSTGAANTAGKRLYESVGFEIVNEYIEYVKPA